MTMRAPLGRVRGLGSAKDGTGHHWYQRLTAAALVPLVLWFVIGLAAHAGAERGDVLAWMANPCVAIAFLLLVLVGFWHMKLGAQVVIEDYVVGERLKLASLALLNFACVAVGIACVYSILKISL